LEWIGYSSVDLHKPKERYIQLLENNFSLGNDYEHLTSSKMKRLGLSPGRYIELPANFNQHNKAKHLIVAPDCFKESLMLIQTAKAKQIRKYYLTLEKVFKAYLKYCGTFNEQKLLETKAELEESKRNSVQFKEMIVKKTLFSCDQYVYVATSATYAKNNIFKIGMTSNIEKRINGYTTGRCSGDQFSYVYIMKCVDAKALEQYIFTRLEHFRYSEDKLYKRELFQIHFSLLMTIMSEFELYEQQSTTKFNVAMSEYYNTINALQPIDYDEIIVQDIGQYVNDKGLETIDLRCVKLFVVLVFNEVS
jgi:hypothetical protein